MSAEVITALTVYGPLGIFCVLLVLAYREKDKDLRIVNDKRVAEAIAAREALATSAAAVEDVNETLKGALTVMQTMHGMLSALSAPRSRGSR